MEQTPEKLGKQYIGEEDEWRKLMKRNSKEEQKDIMVKTIKIYL